MKRSTPGRDKQRVDWETLKRRLSASGAERGSERAAAILDERARLLAKPIVTAEAADDELQVTRFKLAGETYAIETRYVREVLAPPPITRIPGAPPHLVGVTAVRGLLLAVFDLGVLLGLPPRGPAAPVTLLVLGVEDADCAIAAEAVADVSSIAPEELREPPPVVGGLGPDTVVGVTSEPCIVLNGAVILKDPRLLIDQNGM